MKSLWLILAHVITKTTLLITLLYNVDAEEKNSNLFVHLPDILMKMNAFWIALNKFHQEKVLAPLLATVLNYIDQFAELMEELMTIIVQWNVLELLNKLMVNALQFNKDVNFVLKYLCPPVVKMELHIEIYAKWNAIMLNSKDSVFAKRKKTIEETVLNALTFRLQFVVPMEFNMTMNVYVHAKEPAENTQTELVLKKNLVQDVQVFWLQLVQRKELPMITSATCNVLRMNFWKTDLVISV